MEQEKIKDDMNINDLALMMAKGFFGVEERLTNRINQVESTLTQRIDQVSTNLQSFKTETKENFEKLSKDIKDNEESTNAIVADYHPRIIAIEEKVFGHSTLVES